MSSEHSGNKDNLSKFSSKTNKSFVENVTSRVSGLFPSTITKWFGASSSSNANGSTITAESTDSSTEDEATESSMPPAKRMRYSSPGKTAHYTSIHTKCSSTNTETIETFSSVQSPPGNNTFRRETNYVSTPVQTRSDDTSLVESETQTNLFNMPGSISTINKSIDRKRKFLFDKPNNDVQKPIEKPSAHSVGDLNQPYFKSSLLGSPFYSGRTVYGGAASSYMNPLNIKHRKVTLVNESSNTDNIAISQSARRVLDILENYSSPLIDAKRISQFVGTNSNSNSLNYSIDNSTSSPKSISYKTQELHVPSIATILRLKRKSRLMDTTNAARQIIASHSSSSGYFPYPSSSGNQQKDSTEKLTTKIKSKLTRINRDQESPVSSNINFPSASLQIDQNNLPTFSISKSDNVKTSVTTSHSIDTQTHIKTYESKSTHIEQELPKSGGNIIGSRNFPTEFKFSSSERVSNEVPLITTPKQFTFGSPERTLEKDSVNKLQSSESKESSGMIDGKKISTHNDEESNTDRTLASKTMEAKNTGSGSNGPDLNSGFNNAKSEKAKESKDLCNLSSDSNINKKINESNDIDKISALNSIEQKCEVCFENNKSDCVCSANKSNLFSNNKETKKNNMNESNNSKWKCEDCWVTNNLDIQKCVCCGASKPNKKPKNNENNNNFSITNDKQNVTMGDWRCDICWIKNKPSKDKCEACGEAKPGQTSNKINSVAPKSFSFTPVSDSGDKIVKTQSNMWECTVCLVGNENNRSTCVCCEAEKPGSKKVLQKTSFSFGQAQNMTFKFGINPVEPVKEKKTEEKSEIDSSSVVKETETNNNNISKTPGSTAIFTEKQGNSTKVDIAKPQETPLKTFTFGIPKQVPSQSETIIEPNKQNLVLPVITLNESKNPNEKDDKIVNMPNFNSTPKLPEPSKMPSNLFTLPIQNVENKTSTPVLLPTNPLLFPNPKMADCEKKDSTNVIAPITTASTIDTNIVPSTFVFSASVPNSAEKLFSSPVTTVTTASSSFAPLNMPLFQKTESTNPTSLPLFPNKDSTPTSSIFSQKTETTTAPVTVTQAASTPAPAIFSFGNNQNAVPQTEKPKFNFSFGSTNKTETNMFKPMFGNATESNISANKFNFSATNSLGSSSTLSGNALGSNNGLVTANVAPNNLLAGSNNSTTGNTLGTSDLSANPLNTGNNITINSSLPTVPQTGIFGAPVQKENMWSANNNVSSNLFVSSTNTSTSTVQKPAGFTFGSPTAFSSNANTGNFGVPTTGQQTQHVFGISTNQTNNQPSLFSNQIQNPTPTNIFGSSQPANNPSASVGLFGATNIGSSSFGSTNSTLPTFEAPSATPSATPFNFGAQQQPPAVFGFSQQQQQTQLGGVYNFGASGGTGQVQFNIGSATNPSVRRVRKAIRRTTQR